MLARPLHRPLSKLVSRTLEKGAELDSGDDGLVDENSIRVSGAGSTAANGIYTWGGGALINGRKLFLDGSEFIYWEVSPPEWRIESNEDILYKNVTDSENPANGTWVVAGVGILPAPTVTLLVL